MRWRFFNDRTSLRGAAATIFALTAILPLSTLVALLWHLNLLGDPRAQVNVLLALVIALLGFVLFQHLIRRISSVAAAVQGGRPLPGAEPDVIPAVGRVSEIGQITDAFATLLADLRGSTERLSDSVVKLGTLNEMAELGTRIPALHELLDAVLERTMRTVHAGIGSIMLLDAEQRTLRIAASRGLAHPEGTELAVGDGIAGKVAQLGEAVVVEDIETDPRFARASDPKYGGGSFICLPIRARDQVIGVINLARKQPGADAGTVPFSATDLYFLNALMTNVAYAVDNARMLEDSRESARRLQAALDDVKAAQTRLVQGETLRALGELASGMAHHLNNLLSVVIGRIDLLLGLVDVPDHRRRLEAVRAAAHDAADVVRRMLRFTERQRSANMGAVDLNAVAREAVDRLRPRWSDPRRAIHLALELGDIPPVWGDEAALCEALHHVLVNAVEALPNGGAVVVRTWASDDAVVCAVEDTGAGMSEEERAHATEPFFTTKGPKGTGLGLSATYGIIEQHGGELSIASAAGRGTTVTMRLPLAPAAARRPGLPSPGLRILLVDDDHALRHVLADILGEEGHAVVEATRGADALMHLERGEPFDLVLTDLHMPDVTGWDVARAVKARWPKIAVVLITGSGPDAEGTDAEREVVDMTLAKPVTIEALRAMAETIGAR